MSTSLKILSILFLVVVLPVVVSSQRDWIQLAAVSMSSQGIFSEQSPIAVWEWRPITGFSDEEILKLLDYSQKKGIDVIFLSIDEYIDIVENKDSLKKEQLTNQFKNRLGVFLEKAAQRNIKIYALAGHPDWATESHRYITEELTLFALNYNLNRSVESGYLQGIQFDIEPHSLDEYNRFTAYDYLLDLQKTVDLVVLTFENNSTSTFDVGFAIPFWFDEENELSPEIEWTGKRQAVFYHIADRLADLPSSHIALMTYRNRASGQNGTLQISKGEFEYINRMNYSTKLWIGQEVTDVNPVQITFFNSKWSQILSEFKAINSALVAKVEFAGIIINDLESLGENYPN